MKKRKLRKIKHVNLRLEDSLRRLKLYSAGVGRKALIVEPLRNEVLYEKKKEEPIEKD